MNTGSRDEQQMLANIGRIAKALERIADELERRDERIAEHVRERIDERADELARAVVETRT